MFRLKPTSRVAQKLRRWRGRYGISAPRVAVRAEWPLHWRALAIVFLSACSLALAGWIYDAGRRFAGFHQETSAQEMLALRERVAQLEAELTDTRRVANSSDSRLRIESTAQDRLAQQVKSLEEENVRLKADLSIFENLASGSAGPAGVVISRFQIIQEGPGRYRYRLIVAQQGASRDREFRGQLRFHVTLTKGSETVNMEIPEKAEVTPAQYGLNFRLFGRFDGVFSVPPELRLVRVEARVIEAGAIRVSSVASL